jgi:hypothetical protein
VSFGNRKSQIVTDSTVTTAVTCNVVAIFDIGPWTDGIGMKNMLTAWHFDDGDTSLSIHLHISWERILSQRCSEVSTLCWRSVRVHRGDLEIVECRVGINFRLEKLIEYKLKA